MFKIKNQKHKSYKGLVYRKFSGRATKEPEDLKYEIKHNAPELCRQKDMKYVFLQKHSYKYNLIKIIKAKLNYMLCPR